MNIGQPSFDSSTSDPLAGNRDSFPDVTRCMYDVDDTHNVSQSNLAYENGELDLVPAALCAHTQNRRFNID